MHAVENLDVPVRGAWRHQRLLITRAARAFNHGLRIAERAAALGIEVIELPGDRLNLPSGDDARRAYVEAKSTLAIVVAPPSKRRLHPIAPSADRRVDLAEGCPAHCSHCYRAGSLKGAWWDDGAPDMNRRMPRSTHYALWFKTLGATT